jgi:hypothetical protein
MYGMKEDNKEKKGHTNTKSFKESGLEFKQCPA